MKDGSHVGVYTDITEQKQRQAEIANAKGEANPRFSNSRRLNSS